MASKPQPLGYHMHTMVGWANLTRKMRNPILTSPNPTPNSGKYKVFSLSTLSILKGSVGKASYLGLPLGAPRNSMAVWDLIEERFQKRLAL